MHNADMKTLEGEEKPVSLPVTGSVYAGTHIYRYVNNTHVKIKHYCTHMHICMYVCSTCRVYALSCL